MKKATKRPTKKLRKLKKYLEDEQTNTDTKNMIFQVPEGMHASFKQLAADEGLSMNKLFRAMTRRLFDEEGITF